MNNTEVLNKIEDALELDLNSLNVETPLEEVPEFDSMGKLSLIVLADEDFEKKLTGEQIRDFKTVGDIVSFLQG